MVRVLHPARVRALALLAPVAGPTRWVKTLAKAARRVTERALRNGVDADRAESIPSTAVR